VAGKPVLAELLRFIAANEDLPRTLARYKGYDRDTLGKLLDAAADRVDEAEAARAPPPGAGSKGIKVRKQLSKVEREQRRRERAAAEERERQAEEAAAEAEKAKRTRLFTDGAARGNPGPAGARCSSSARRAYSGSLRPTPPGNASYRYSVGAKRSSAASAAGRPSASRSWPRPRPSPLATQAPSPLPTALCRSCASAITATRATRCRAWPAPRKPSSASWREANSRSSASCGSCDLTSPSSQIFGTNVFSVDVQRQRLPKTVSKELQAALAKGGALDRPLADGEFAGRRSATRTVPGVSVDAGWVLERDSRWFGRAMRQTLEPRLLYVNTAYRNQAGLPTFDFAPKDFNFESIFTENDFSGVDRVADANQLTAGVTTRVLDPATGAEALRLGVVQRFRFRDQRVTATADGGPDGPVSTQRFSDVLLRGSTTLSKRWNLDGSIQYSPDLKRTVRSILGARYSPGPYRTFGVTYRLARGLSEQLELGWQWPIYGRTPAEAAAAGGECKGSWYSVGRVNYSMRDSRITDSVVGLEYDAGCWIGRVVAERLSTGRSEATTRLLLQLELVGLSRLGSNPLQVLKDNIPGSHMSSSLLPLLSIPSLLSLLSHPSSSLLPAARRRWEPASAASASRAWSSSSSARRVAGAGGAK